MIETKKVLIVEDDVQSCQNLYDIFKDHFHHVHTAQDGAQGWELFLEVCPDIIITDISMPHISGLELIGRIRKTASHHFIAVLTSYSSEHYLMQAVVLKLDGYILKPLTHTKMSQLFEDIHDFYGYSNHNVILGSQTVYDMQSKLIIHADQRTQLSHKEITLLELLLTHKGSLVGYEQIIAVFDHEGDMSRNAMKILVSHLRKKIPQIEIQAIYNVGYVLK